MPRDEERIAYMRHFAENCGHDITGLSDEQVIGLLGWTFPPDIVDRLAALRQVLALMRHDADTLDVLDDARREIERLRLAKNGTVKATQDGAQGASSSSRC